VSAFPSPAFSVNRTKFGPPDDALLPHSIYDGYGLFTYTVADIPPAYVHVGTEYSFRVLHLPEERNYHHSEIRTFIGETDLASEVPERKAPKPVRKYFRTALARRALILKRPTI
jgi:hypothetical protein